jgi:hypothetical protein
MFTQHFMIKTNNLQRISLTLVILLVTTVGVYMLVASHADTPYTSVNTASGTLTGGASQQSCSGASNGGCVLFGSTGASTEQANLFVNSIGVNIHINYSTTAYANYTALKNSLVQLGIHYVRDQSSGGGAGSYQVQHWNDLYSTAGIQLSLILDSRYSSATTWVPTVQALGKTVWEVEGQNEPDNPKAGISLNEAVSEQQELYTLFKANTATASVPIASPSWIEWSQSAANQISQTARGYFDYGNIHSYPSNPSSMIGTLINEWEQAYSNKPLVASEEGWPTGNDGYTLGVQAKNVTRMYLENFSRGITKTFAYELVDEQNNLADSEDNFGLLYNNWTPKPAYTALQNLIGLLNDPGPSFQPSALSYSLSGSTANVKTLLLEKRNGTFYLVLWDECGTDGTSEGCDSSNVDSGAPVTVNFSNPISQLSTILPDESVAPIAEYSNITSVNLDVPDEPLVLQINP